LQWFDCAAFNEPASRLSARRIPALSHTTNGKSSYQGESKMLGLFAMLLVSAALVVVASYWIFWEMENAQQRPQFMAKVWNDFAGLFGRKQSAPQISPKQSAAA
jgi:hypothetical protein